MKNHTDLFAANAAHVWEAGAANSITSMQNWPQARFVRFQRNPQQEKAKVVRPEQIRVATFLNPPATGRTTRFFRPQQNPQQKARNVSSEQIRLLPERTISFTGGGASQHNAGVRHSIRSARLTTWG